MDAKVSVIIKEPGRKPRHVNISTRLENLQKTVGGHIEALTVASDCCFILNEEGKLQGLPYNFAFCGEKLVGTVILIGVNGDAFCDCPLSFVDAKHLIPSMFVE